MKKTLMMAMVVVLGFSFSAMGTDTRVLTLGDNNMVLLDDANIWLFPSRIFEYPNLAVGEFGNPEDDFTQFGVHWKFGSSNPIVVGTYFTDLPAWDPQNLYRTDGDLIPFDSSLWDNRRIDFFYGNELSRFNLGMRMSLTQSSQVHDIAGPPSDQSKESFSYVDFGFSATALSGMWDVALNLAKGSWTDRGEDGLIQSDADGFYDISIVGRCFREFGADYTLVPHVGLYRSKRGVEIYDTIDSTIKKTESTINLGCGLNYTPTRNVLAVADFGFMHTTWKQEILEILIPAQAVEEGEEETLTTIPYFKIGFDADVFKWMDVRFGATSFWNKEVDKDRDAGNKSTYKWAENNTYLGFGFHWNRLRIDTYTDPDLFLRGFDFINGKGTGSDMNFQISAVYEM